MPTPALSRTRDEFADLAGDGPAVVHVAADLDVDCDPLTAYAALRADADRPFSFLLESGEKVASHDPDGAFAPEEATRHARYSYVGVDPAAVVTLGPDGPSVDVFEARYADALRAESDGDVLDDLRAALPDVERRGFERAERFAGGLVGFLAYDAVYDLWLEEVGVERPDSPVPDAQFVLSETTLAFDHHRERCRLVFTPLVGDDDDPEGVYDALLATAERVDGVLSDATPPTRGGFQRTGERAGSREAYEAAVRRAKEHVLDGDIYQGVVSRERELRGEVDPLRLYASLREINPSPYMYVLDYDERTVVGASPETLVSVRDGRVTANPIAGTCARGTSPVEDRRLAGELLADDKERAEHTMLVDLARNDVRRVSEPGSVRVEEFMNVLKYSHVQHIESTVTGRLAPPFDAFDATRASFPAGTLSGAPKVRAMELIDELEETPRGIYGGGVGYFSWDGDADVAIVIRSALVERDGAETSVTVRAGAGLVADSDPAAEYEETEKKMRGVLAALEAIERPPTEVSR
ncbi:anthranilate synthase component I [Halomarina ordinaria]|uniref:Anthranilate synthase component 1 n=1 Tax=Halomarina ordinaria TaxID=3033939 RepID=A0ABD5UEJ5_9EURY|nr:anthranilate synthase component I [Halomarina sp. PSRA2]